MRKEPKFCDKFCGRCGKGVAIPFRLYATALVINGVKKCGKCLCAACADKVLAEAKKSMEAEG